MANRPIILLHGYGADAEDLTPWRDALAKRGYTTAEILLGNYISLSNEITIRDIAEAFDLALRELGVDGKADFEFDAIVHSTGSLVVREWLVSYHDGPTRLKHLIGLAPANFGSPMAHKGRTIVGAVWKGRKNNPHGPDYLEPGRLVLSALELGSSYTWGLAHRDLLEPREVEDPSALKPIFSATADTPFPFTLIGLDDYWISSFVPNEKGYDGTVRWAGAALNTRKLLIDLTVAPPGGDGERIAEQERRDGGLDIPHVLLAGLDHSAVMKRPPPWLVDMVADALGVDDATAYATWGNTYGARLPLPEPSPQTSPRRWPVRIIDEDGKPEVVDASKRDPAPWQQFVVRVVDERGDPVPDYYIALGTGTGPEFKVIEGFHTDVHEYKDDTSLRCFHVNLDDVPDAAEGLQIRLAASSGTPWVTYAGVGADAVPTGSQPDWTAAMDLPLPDDMPFRIFYPYTTTLVEIRINRQPTTDLRNQRLHLLHFLDL